MLCFYIIIILFSLIAARQLFLPGYFPMHDDLQIGRLYQMDKCIKDGQIPCRWVPDMGYGYGYPLFNFYPPFPYYLGEIFHLLGFSFINSIKLVFILGLSLSGIFMFLLTRKFWGDLGGLVSAVFYIWAPYHAVDLYVRGAMGEFWAITFFPGIFWVVAELVKKRQNRHITLLALFYGLLLLSHNIMAMLFSPLIVAWALFLIWYYKQSLKARFQRRFSSFAYKKPVKSLVPVVLGGIWGVGLAAFFTLPAFFEKKFVHVETMLMGYFNYLAHFVNLRQLFLSRFWGYGPSTWGDGDGMPFQIGHLHWIVPAVSFGLFFWLWLRKKTNLCHLLLVTCYMFLFLFSAFLAHLRSTPIWQAVKPLEYLQFPWRFLAITIFAVSVASGSIIFALEKAFGNRKKDKRVLSWLATGLIVAVVALNFIYFKPEKILRITDEEKLFSPKGWHKLQTDAIFDYLPVYAEKPPGEVAPEEPEVLEGKVGITYLKKGTDWLQFDAKVLDGPTKIRLPIYDYPGWKVWIDKMAVKIDHDNFLGLITFNIPPGDHNISARLTNTSLRTFSNLVSLVSWLALAFFFVFPYRFNKLIHKSRMK